MESPKQRFLKTPEAKLYHAAVSTIAFELGCDAAMLQFMQELPNHGDTILAANADQQRQGAKRMLKLIQTIAKPDEKQEATPPGQLRHDL